MRTRRFIGMVMGALLVGLPTIVCGLTVNEGGLINIGACMFTVLATWLMFVWVIRRVDEVGRDDNEGIHDQEGR